MSSAIKLKKSAGGWSDLSKALCRPEADKCYSILQDPSQFCSDQAHWSGGTGPKDRGSGRFASATASSTRELWLADGAFAMQRRIIQMRVTTFRFAIEAFQQRQLRE